MSGEDAVEDEDDQGELGLEEQIAVAALAAGATYTEAGAMVGRSAKWIQRHLKDPTFATALATARVERVKRALDRLDNGLEPAVDTVVRALDAGDVHVRLRAAGMLINASIKLRTAARLEEAVFALRTELDELRERIGGAA